MKVELMLNFDSLHCPETGKTINVVQYAFRLLIRRVNGIDGTDWDKMNSHYIHIQMISEF